MSDKHISSVFDRDLGEIQANVLRMGGMVEVAIQDSATALRTRDGGLAEEVRKRDKAIDQLDLDVNEACAQMIALRQPAASDLRQVLAVLRVTHNLERIGDYAKNLAKRTEILIGLTPIESTNVALSRMSNEVHEMLSDVLDAYGRRDADLAEQVRQRDLDVDQMYNAVFRELLTHMMEDPRAISAAMHLHFIAKNIERMGDHVTAIAEQVIYFVTGAMPEDDRPKARSLDTQS